MTNLQLVDFCKSALKLPTVYMWGTWGNVLTKDIIEKKIKQYPNKYSTTRQGLLKKRIDGVSIGCDCAGLIKWFLWSGGDISVRPKYSSKTDRGCGGLYRAANEKGPIAVLPEIPGLIVYKSDHVGVYIGKGKVIECTLGSRGDGVVESDIRSVKWTHWLKIPELTYITPPTGKPKISITKKMNIWQKLGILFQKKGAIDK